MAAPHAASEGAPEERGMVPTGYLRFVLRDMPQTWGSDGTVVLVRPTRILQQKWVHTLVAAPGEWHDVPLAAAP